MNRQKSPLEEYEMPNSSKPKFFLYWDSCVFLAFLNQEVGRADVIQTLWDEIAKNNKGQIITSAISIAEVAAAQQERDQHAIQPDTEAKIDAMWNDPTVQLIEVMPQLLFGARQLMRDALTQKWSLKSNDAIHLATARWVNRFGPTPIQEIHTYDHALSRYSAILGVHVCEPHINQPRLFMDE